MSYEDDTLEAQVSVARCGGPAELCLGGLGRGWVPRAFQPPGLLLWDHHLSPVTRRGPARADGTPGVLSVTTAVTWLLSSVRGVGGGVEGISSLGDAPQAWLSAAGGRTSSCLGLSGQAALLCFHQEA